MLEILPRNTRIIRSIKMVNDPIVKITRVEVIRNSSLYSPLTPKLEITAAITSINFATSANSS